VVASEAAADRLGVADDARVRIRGWAQATDPVYVAEHDELWRSPGMAAALGGALRSAGLDLGGVDVADLYSCFPSSVDFALDALDALGVPARTALAPYTVTGGLPYAGGAGSCYLLSALAALADRLVAQPGATGLVSGVGMHLTKHVAAVLSTAPGAPPAPSARPAAAGPAVVRPIVDRHHGPATVAAYTVHHDRSGDPVDAVLVCDVDGRDDGARCYAKAVDADLLVALEADEWVGRSVGLVDGGDGVNLVPAP
jgi:acetyl-CoA C-acetyltransferase